MAEGLKLDLTDPGRFSHWAADTLRYCDTDRQGHINNIAFATFCETGRMKFLLDRPAPLEPAGHSFVIARLAIDFRGEMRWPGEVRIGTATLSIGRSSFTLGQGLFVDEACVATAESVVVLTDEATRRSAHLPEDARARLSELLLKA